MGLELTWSDLQQNSKVKKTSSTTSSSSSSSSSGGGGISSSNYSNMQEMKYNKTGKRHRVTVVLQWWHSHALGNDKRD